MEIDETQILGQWTSIRNKMMNGTFSPQNILLLKILLDEFDSGENELMTLLFRGFAFTYILQDPLD